MMYESRISSKVIIEKKTGNARLEEFDVDVNGYRYQGKLREAKEKYGSNKRISLSYENHWSRTMWNYLFEEYYKVLRDIKINIKRNRKNKLKNCKHQIY